jgi:uncharacterized protein (UPF0332 family)
MATLNPDHLIDQAERLTATTSSGPPRQADLRRAISTAYYAVFHAVAKEAADQLVARTQRDTPRYQQVYKSIEHKRLRNVCEDLAKSTPPTKYARYLPASGLGSELVAVATAVSELQESRNLADYDSLFRAKTSDVALAIEKARNAVARLSSADREQKRIFISLIVFPLRGMGSPGDLQ